MFLNSLLLWLITKVLWSGATSICDGFIFCFIHYGDQWQVNCATHLALNNTTYITNWNNHEGCSVEVWWVSVAPRARTSVAKVRTSTQPCWATSTGSPKDARTFSPTVATEVFWLGWNPHEFTVSSWRQRWRMVVGSWRSWWSDRVVKAERLFRGKRLKG